MEDDEVDSVIVIFIPPLVTRAADVAAAIRDVAAEYRGGKPLLACFMSAQGAPPELTTVGPESVPAFAFPEATAISLGRVCDYAEWRRQPKGTVPKLEALQSERGREIVQGALAGDKSRRVWLPMDACAELLECYGIHAAKVRLARTAEGAGAAAAEIGFPVAAKVASTTITHKTDIGGVALGLQSAEAVGDAFRLMEERLRTLGKRDEMDGVIVQEMVDGGIEAIVGVTQDPSFGPLIMFGLGGVQVELLKDVAFRIHPLTDLDAKEMIRSIKGYPLLDGWRGAPPGDIPALEGLLLRISALVEDLP
jgi:acyl-CoA synthetase (NDP forming)